MRLRKHIKKLKPQGYVEAPPPPHVVDCSLGVNPYGCAPALRDVSISAKDTSPYPQPDGAALRQRLAAHWQNSLTADNFVLQTGSMGVLQLANQIMLSDGDGVLGPAPLFVDYRFAAEAAGATYTGVPLLNGTEWALTADAFIGHIKSRHKIIYIDSPNNPTGKSLPLSAIEKIAIAAKENGSLLIVDEAYGDFLPPGRSAIQLVPKYSHLLVVRSFSKGFGLAGIRAGYGVAGGVLSDAMRRADTLFALGTPSLFFAEQALKHTAFLTDSAHRIAAAKKQLLEELTAIHYAETDLAVPIALLFYDDDKPLAQHFKEQRVLVSSGKNIDGLDKRYARLRIPPDDELPALFKAVRAIQKT